MATYIKFNNSDTLYPAVIGGKMSDKDWDGRASKFIHIEMSYEEVASMFVDDVAWSIVQDVEHQEEIVDEETQEVIVQTVIEKETYDNSDHSVLGDITVHADGTVTVKMGKPTADEILAMFEEVL
jgi:hypothetical protein